MKKLRKITFVTAPVIFLTFIMLAGCEKKAAQKPVIPSEVAPSSNIEVKGTVIAKINDYAITLEDLNAEINSFNAEIPADKVGEKIESREKKISYLKDGMVRKIMLYQAALKRGLDKTDEVRKAIENFKQSILVAELVREETANIEPSAQEIEDYYNQFKEQLKEPEERHLREIIVANEDQAKEILIEVLKGADFVAMAQERSISASTKNKGGDLGYISLGSKFPQFDEAAFSPALDVGKTSNYFKGPEGYYIVKLEDKRGGKAKPLRELREDIKKGLTFLKQQQKIEELIGKLSESAKTEINEGLIN